MTSKFSKLLSILLFTILLIGENYAVPPVGAVPLTDLQGPTAKPTVVVRKEEKDASPSSQSDTPVQKETFNEEDAACCAYKHLSKGKAKSEFQRLDNNLKQYNQKCCKYKFLPFIIDYSPIIFPGIISATMSIVDYCIKDDISVITGGVSFATAAVAAFYNAYLKERIHSWLNIKDYTNSAERRQSFLDKKIEYICNSNENKYIFDNHARSYIADAVHDELVKGEQRFEKHVGILLSDGKTTGEIAKMTGVDHSSILQIQSSLR